MAETGRPWPECPDLVKMYMRIMPTNQGLTPFEIVYGRPVLHRPPDTVEMPITLELLRQRFWKKSLVPASSRRPRTLPTEMERDLFPYKLCDAYWLLPPEAHEWKKMIKNPRVGHDNQRNTNLEITYTSNKIGNELMYAVPSVWGGSVYPIFICTYPVERNKPAAIEVIYSKRGQKPLVGIAPVVEE